ncbi:MAG: DNA primase [Gammaproteobacteria bacterium]
MPGLIPRNFINDLLARIDIVDVISPRIKLRKTGGNYSALCPFHKEKTPSFSVNPAKQFFYCFGCGAHGDAIKFVMQFDRLDFLDAVELLAGQIGLEVPHETLSPEKQVALEQHKKSYDLLAKVANFYEKSLTESSKAEDYLRTRGLNAEVRKRYALGYAPGMRGGLVNYLQKNNFSNKETSEILLQNGLLLKNDSGTMHERFRDRIMFPIRDRRGRVIAFGGRAFGDEMPKYLNSPETPIFHKGSELYGLYEARQATPHLEKVLVVEGYMDVIALAQYGIDFAVATMGTAITDKHVQKLLRETKEIIFSFDGDNAGQNAAWRALENILPLMRDDMQVKFLFLPTKDDPDSYIRKEGQLAFLRSIESSVPLSDFLFQKLSSDLDLNKPDGRAVFVQKTRILLDKMPQGVFQEMLWQKLAQLVHSDVNTLRKTQTSAEPSHQPPAEIYTRNNSFQQHSLPQPAKTALSLLLYHPALVKEIVDLEAVRSLNLPSLSLLFWLFELLQKRPDLTLTEILESCQDPAKMQFLAEIAINPPLIPQSGLKSEFLGAIDKLHGLSLDQTIDELMQKSSQGTITNEEKALLCQLITQSKK